MRPAQAAFLAALTLMATPAAAQTLMPVESREAGFAATLASLVTGGPEGAVAGANSFTQSQARARIEAAGLSNPTPLLLGHDGVWRGVATGSAGDVSVAVDYRGRVTAEGSPDLWASR